MKTPATSQREQAVALIIVLAMLLLLSGLIVSFMTSVSNERAASVANNSGLSTRQLADSTVSFVIGQMRQATTQAEAASVPTTWASQPGAIRTYSGTVGSPKNITTGASGVSQFTYKPGPNDFVFKLYSAEKMKIPATDLAGKNWDPNELDVIEKWDRTKPDQFKGYVDLNDPIIAPLPFSISGGDPTKVEPRYPIIDPRAKFLVNEKANSTPDPGIVEGFDIKTTGLSDPNLTAYNSVTRNSTPVQYLPMPVKWLYVMRDGSMAAADTTSGKIPGASLENPIVGRTAFWADDESCKLNINTGSEGTYWDTPTMSTELVSGNVDGGGVMTSSTFSLSLSASQPVRGEYNRYPGHPATTSLSPALGWVWYSALGNSPLCLPPGAPPAAIGTRDAKLVSLKESLLQLAPFTPNFKKTGLGNTSMSGNYNADVDMPIGGDQIPQLNVVTKRLYTSVDELVFKSDRNDGTLKKATPLNNETLTPDKLEKVRFFLTANSRSPELNLFGRPRVTFWPVNTNLELRTGFDDLFAFTSTLYKDPNGVRENDNTFYFTRYDAKSQENDYKNTPPNNPTNKNEKIMDYLRLMTGDGAAFSRIPGFGGSFASKYDQGEKEEILNLIFDYCRCVNLVDTSKRNRAGAYQPYTPFYAPNNAGSGYQDWSARSNDWSGLVTPIRINNSNFQGLGRFPTISEAAMIFYRTGAIRADTFQAELRAALVFEMMTPMPGYPAIRETFWTRVTVDRPTLVDVDGTTPPIANRDINLVGPIGQRRDNIVNVASHDVGWSRGYLPTLGFMNQVHYYKEPAGWTDIADPAPPLLTGQATPKKFEKHISTLKGGYQRTVSSKYYPFISDPFLAPASQNGSPKLKFRGGSYKVEIFSGEAPDDGRSQLVQTIEIDFDDGKQVEVDVPIGVADRDATLDKRITGRQSFVGFPGDGFDDVVRGLEYTGGKHLPLNQKGDFRLLMCRRYVPKTMYEPRMPAVYYTNVKMVHGLQRSWGDGYPGYQPTASTDKGSFYIGGTIRSEKAPILPGGIKGVLSLDGGMGDWDRGLSKHQDGAFGGKVDEGNVWFNYADSADGGKVPYFRGRGIEETGRSFFSPNRQLASAVMFGSLPTGVVRGLPWQTLLFRPNRGAKSHPGAQSASLPADHLLLDLFNLPVVEPYAISEPFSTGGKVNLNYVIAPFGYAKGDTGVRRNNVMARSYLRRDTALRGIFKAVKIMAIPTSQPTGGHSEGPANTSTAVHFDIDAEKTLDQFESRLKDPDRGLFRSASEICDMDLYPAGYLAPAVTNGWATFWETTFAQTGDNMRERPYAHIYPRVTTKSNIFTVHMRCQAVKKVPGTPPDEFDAKRDKVLAEYRGNATIERFIDPNDPDLKDYDATLGTSSVDPFYRYRVIGTKQFLPR